MGPMMLRLAEEVIATWRLGEPVDLWANARQLIRTFAIGLLFGGSGAGLSHRRPDRPSRVVQLVDRRRRLSDRPAADALQSDDAGRRGARAADPGMGRLQA